MTDNNEKKIQAIDAAYKEFSATLNEIQRERWNDFLELMKNIDEAEAEMVRKQILNS